MNEASTLAPALVAGAALGTVFFAGLWWTVRKGVSSPRPALWFAGSLLLRMSLVLVGFHYIGGGEWNRLLAGLLGFVSARFLVLRFTRRAAGHAPVPAKENRHAS